MSKFSKNITDALGYRLVCHLFENSKNGIYALKAVGKVCVFSNCCVNVCAWIESELNVATCDLWRRGQYISKIITVHISQTEYFI